MIKQEGCFFIHNKTQHYKISVKNGHTSVPSVKLCVSQLFMYGFTININFILGKVLSVVFLKESLFVNLSSPTNQKRAT